MKLANAILLSGIKQGAEAIRIRPDGVEVVVELLVDGETREELRGPVAVFGGVIRRLSVMANLPLYGKDQYATGFIELVIGDATNVRFAIRVEGHGAEITAQLHLLRQ